MTTIKSIKNIDERAKNFTFMYQRSHTVQMKQKQDFLEHFNSKHEA